MQQRTLDRRCRALYRNFVEPGDLAFDIGANVGQRTRALLAVGANVVAVEPQPECAQRLPTAATVVQAAVGAEQGTTVLHLTDETTLASMSPEWIDAIQGSGRFTHTWTDRLVVPVTTLDELIAEHGEPRFCKIDVEGAEQLVLAGLSQPLRAVSFEHANEFVDATEACIARCVELGMTEFNFSLFETLELHHDAWTDAATLLRRLGSLGMTHSALFGDVYARISVNQPR
ncbi:MAG TPA: FkbM family methyltransferase [Gaiellaceae bacterium]|nr:FkbM family methyltransferase [Gaiellaceae bacterium]